MRNIKKHLIIGLVIIGVTLQATNAQALYSSTIAQQVAIIQEHVLSSQSKNGSGDLMSAIESVKSYNEKKRALKDEGGIAGEARVAQQMIAKQTYEQALANPFDSLLMAFNFNAYNDQWISNCLRNDIWSLEALRDLVGAEMVKAYLMFDRANGALLEEDYNYIIGQLSLLRKYGSDPYALINGADKAGKPKTMTSNEYFFGMPPEGDGAVNFYTQKYFDSDKTGCPDGEFEQVFQNVANSWETLKVMGSGQSVEWGSIWQMAKANARIRARQWTQANQLSLSIGGTEGARIQSLVKGDGWEKFAGNMRTQAKIIENMVGPVTPLFSRKIWKTHLKGVQKGGEAECTLYHPEDNLFRDCTNDQIEQYKACKENREEAEANGILCLRYKNVKEATTFQNILNNNIREERENREAKKEALTAFNYSINLDSVSEQSIIDLEGILKEMNGTIQRSYEGIDEKAGAGIPSLRKEILGLSRNQCVNKQSGNVLDF